MNKIYTAEPVHSFNSDLSQGQYDEIYKLETKALNSVQKYATRFDQLQRAVLTVDSFKRACDTLNRRMYEAHETLDKLHEDK